MRVVELSVTTNSSGVGSVTVDLGAPYLLYKVEYNVGNFAAGVDPTLSNVSTRNGTDEAVLTLTDANSDAVHYPVVAESSNAGAAETTKRIPIVGNSVKLAIAQGGDTKTGAMWLTLVEV